MQTIFIKETNAISFKDKFILILKRIFNKIDIVNKENVKMYILPINKNKKISKKIINRLSKKIVRCLEQDGTNRVVLSKCLKEIDSLKNNLYSENINILDGRYLFKLLSGNIIKYILKLKKEEINLAEVLILVNDFNDINKEIIIDIAKKVKTLTVITNHINKCKKIESYLYEEYGILLSVSNSKKTSLLTSKLILNLDFPEENLNQYRINTKAIIVNMLNKIQIQSKKYNGININYYNIDIPNMYKIDEFKDQEIYESVIYNYNYEQIQEILEKDKIRIKNLIGNSGIISKQEFL